MAKLGATNISIMDVRNILGYPSTDLGTVFVFTTDYYSIFYR